MSFRDKLETWFGASAPNKPLLHDPIPTGEEDLSTASMLTSAAAIVLAASTMAVIAWSGSVPDGATQPSAIPGVTQGARPERLPDEGLPAWGDGDAYSIGGGGGGGMSGAASGSPCVPAQRGTEPLAQAVRTSGYRFFSWIAEDKDPCSP